MSDRYPIENRWGATIAPNAAMFDQALRQHMLRVYNFMMLGLALTGIVAVGVASSPAIYGPIFGTPLNGW